ncbi:hypothetical protein PQI64_11350 [Shewanella bicestrii]
MKRDISLALLAIFIAGCSNTVYVTYTTSPAGADIYELETGKYLGMSPLTTYYDLSKATPIDGCFMIKGVRANWYSGSQSTPYPAYKLCDYKRKYSIEIPYSGDEGQLYKDKGIEELALEKAKEINDQIKQQDKFQRKQAKLAQKQYQQQQQGITEGEALMWSAAINGLALLAGIYTAPIAIQPTQRAPTATEYYQQNYQQPAYYQQAQTTKVAPVPVLQTSSSTPLTASSGCTSDYQCGLGLSCIKGPMQSTGQCMQKVNEYGTPLPTISNPSSTLPNYNINGQCTLNSECPIGFRCDMTLKTCVK